MKRSFLLVIVLLAFNSLFAGPVDVEMARGFGHKFVKANFMQKENNVLDLVYTSKTEAGEPCFYVFNVSDYGFIMVSATDAVRPILGYSEDGVFETDNIAPGLGFVMEDYQDAITYAINEAVVATAEIKAEWSSLDRTGRLKPAERGGYKVGPLCQTAWDQSWPYNYYCPDLNRPFASNGKAVVGCVATAMSQIMKYWNHPAQGVGEHSYKPADDLYGYPEQYANFGEAKYDWENMPYQIDKNSPQEQIEAVALLGYHCGVSVDMMYDDNGTGSGAYSVDVPYALYKYFDYAQSNFRPRTVSSQIWDSYIMEALEMRRPIFYAGTSNSGGGHAFVCDGFDENGLFHYNYGWSGSGDGYFASTAIDYPNDVGAIFDIMPKGVHANTSEAPKKFEVVPAEDNKLSATLSWKNPSYTLNGSGMTTVDKIVIERNGKVIKEFTDVKPGETMTYEDNAVPCYSYFDYSIYAIAAGAHGKVAKVQSVPFGPTCQWQLVLQSSAFQGMRGANVAIYDQAGALITKKTTENSSLTTYDLPLPYGNVKFVWNPADANQSTYNLTMILKDYDGNTVFNFSGSSEEMKGGVFLDTVNNCGYEIPSVNPYNLKCETKDNSIVLNWSGIGGDFYGYNVYRDDLLIAHAKSTTYIDTDVPYGGHCYTVTAFFDGGDTKKSNEACAVLTENCEPATNFKYELTQVFKPKLSWTKSNTTGVSGYYILRKVGKGGEWMRIKVLGANKNEYTDNSVNQYGTWYYYKLQAYYEGIDCMSSPASLESNKDEYVLAFYYSETGVEDNADEKVGIYPNPANEKITIDAQNINRVSISNVMGQKVYETSVSDEQIVVDVNDFPAGVYMIQVVTDEYEVTKRITVAH